MDSDSYRLKMLQMLSRTDLLGLVLLVLLSPVLIVLFLWGRWEGRKMDHKRWYGQD